MNERIDWTGKLNEFGIEVLNRLGEPSPHLNNPIVTRLQADPEGFVEWIQTVPGYSRVNVARLVVICQMMVYDRQRGPEGDGKPKALRRHWYSYFKTKFAQPFAMALGDYDVNPQGVKEIKDLKWTALLSTTYAEFVDKHGVTYRDLWVKDASRMMKITHDILFKGCNIILAVEKDSLFEDFEGAAQALGARAVYSGKGKSSKAAIEKLLRDAFRWRGEFGVDDWGDPKNPFEDDPLIILHISDHDFDGEAVIGPTFVEQARRYTHNVLEARVGIKPEHVDDPEEHWYKVKVANKGYQKWAEDRALFLYECLECGITFPHVGIHKRNCHECGGDLVSMSLDTHSPHGFEVEALPTKKYYRLIVSALLEVLPFDYIVSKLRDDCKADNVLASEDAAEDILGENDKYKELKDEIDRLGSIMDEFRQELIDELYEVGEDRVDDWRDDDDDPEPEEFYRKVERSGSFALPWRPFDHTKRTRSLVDWMVDSDDNADLVDEWINKDLEW